MLDTAADKLLTGAGGGTDRYAKRLNGAMLGQGSAAGRDVTAGKPDDPAGSLKETGRLSGWDRADANGSEAQQARQQETLQQATGPVLELRLEPRILKHMRASRLQPGQRFILGNGRGTFWLLQLVQIDNARLAVTGSRQQDDARAGHLEVRLLGRHRPASAPRLTLVQGLVTNNRMDQIIRQATELGIWRIIPLLSERASTLPHSEQAVQRLQRWQRVALAAAEQSQRAWLPVLEPLSSLDAALELVSDCQPRMCAWEEAHLPASLTDIFTTAVNFGVEISPTNIQESPAAQAATTTNARGVAGAALFIGPVGGFSLSEVRRMRATGCQLLSLGSHILRVETAAVVASALLLYQLGGLGNQRASI